MRRALPTAAAAIAAAAAAGLVTVGAAPAGAQQPSDPGLARQWGLSVIQAPAAWPVSRGAGITIAIIDSGVSATHPDFRGQDGRSHLLGRVDCTGRGPCVEGAGTDDAGHGTHVAGIAAAAADNGGVVGVAPEANILSIKALACDADDAQPCQAHGSEADVAEAIRYAAGHGAQVINLSLGSVTQPLIGPGNEFRAALDAAWDAGAVPVLAAGNEQLLPGSLVDVPAVIVTATDRADRSASYSSGVGNVRWAISAPGGEGEEGIADGAPGSCRSDAPVGILSDYFLTATAQDGYACIAGTSMAAPHVSGALALLLSAGLTPAGAVDRLLGTADDLGPEGRDSTYGSGRVNLARAIEGLHATSATPAVPATEPTTAPTPTDDDGAATPTTAPAEASTTTALAPPGAGLTTPPVTTDAAVDEATGPVTPKDLPAVPLTIAVVAVLLAAGGHAWRYLGTTSWARRTPDR